MSDLFRWRKMKNRDISASEHLLREMENSCVGACGRFLSRNNSTDSVWTLRDKQREIFALIINSRSTILPVLCGKKQIPPLNFLRGFLRAKKIHSAQGLKEEVVIIENALEQMGREAVEIIDYDLMSIDKMPNSGGSSGLSNLILRVPVMTDLDAIAPLQAAYEQEEVVPKGSTFSPAASRVNTANIIAKGQVLAAEIGGRLVGKINVSAVSFTRYQVGGVFVHPDFRRQGIARRMTAEFTRSLISKGMGVTLFVKKSNTAARRLYDSLGFTARGDYRITYY